ncbi:MAG: sulfotransferase family protein [Flavobacteriales bacterium]
MDKPIFILGCTKSGTTLMRNLFDGHPDLFVVPFESHFFQNTGRGIEYKYRRTIPKKLSLEEQKQGLIDWIEFCNVRDNPIADGFSQNKLNVEAARSMILDADVKEERDLADLYVKAIYTAVYEKPIPMELNYVEKSVENAEMSTVWKRLYPNARFVHILRNPYSNLVAMRKYGSHNRGGGFPRLQKPLLAMQNSYYWLYRNMREIPGYQVVLYDDLMKDTEATMKSVAKAMGIEFKESLLQPSTFGQAWGGNSLSGKSFKGVSSRNLNVWKDEITSLETDLVNHYFKHVLEDFGFEIHQANGRKLIPIRGESAKVWLFNRTVKYYL